MIKNITKYFFGMLALIALVGLNAVDSNAGNRRLLVEDHTGANCGYCVLGNQAIEDMQDKFPDDFIGIGMHTTYSAYTDAMAFQGEQEIGSKIGLTGYPSGSINRKSYNGALAQHPVYWDGIISQEVGKPADVDVMVDWTLDKTTGDLTATVSAKMLKAYSGQLAFNLYVMEDGVVGSGSMYDQKNYLSGDGQYKDHPYYSKPAVITNYEHNNVLREMSGGLWGINGEFPATAVNGQTYSHTFTTNIKTKVMNLNKVYVVGAVMETGSKMEILNAIQVGKVLPYKVKANIAADASTHYMTLDAVGGNKTMTFTVSNPGDKSVTAKIEISDLAFIPDSWTSTIDKATVTLAPGKSEVVTVTLNPNGTAGYAVVNITSTPVVKDGEASIVTNAESYALSDASKYIWYLGLDNNLTPQLQSAMSNESFYNKAAFVPFTADVVSNYASILSSSELAIVSEDWGHRGALTTANYTSMIQLLQAMMTNGKKVMITSAVSLINAAGANQTATAESKAFFNTYFGITNNGDPLTVNTVQNNQTYVNPIDCFGFADDFVGKGKTLKLNEYNSSTFPYYTLYVDRIKITGSNVYPAMYYTMGTTTGMDAISAVRYENGNTRAWFSTFGFDLIQNSAQRSSLFDDVINWLINGEETAPSPVITLSESKLAFGDVKEGEMMTKTVTVSNEGNLDLEISNITLDFDNDGFTIADDYTLPLVIKVGESRNFSITFTGITGDLADKSNAINFESNDMESPTVYVDLEATTIAKESAPRVTLSTTSLDWTKVKVDQNDTKTFDIMSKGGEKLTVSEINIGGGNGFTIEDMPSLPLNIDNGQKVTITVTFAPTAEGDFSDMIEIKTNDMENPVVSVDLKGNAIINSVRDGIAGDEGIFTITATPSPMSSVATIKYNVFGNTPRNVSMYIIDNTGAKVQTLLNKSVLGENTMNFDATKLANGSYFIIANLDSYQTQLPIVIAR